MRCPQLSMVWVLVAAGLLWGCSSSSSAADPNGANNGGASANGPGDGVAGSAAGGAPTTAGGAPTTAGGAPTTLPGATAMMSSGWLYTSGNKIYVSNGSSAGTPWLGRGVNVDDLFFCGYNYMLQTANAEALL